MSWIISAISSDGGIPAEILVGGDGLEPPTLSV